MAMAGSKSMIVNQRLAVMRVGVQSGCGAAAKVKVVCSALVATQRHLSHPREGKFL
jgi:hypothetical protein